MYKKEKFNDYELLYLYNRHSEEALDILLSKYERLIDIKLYAFKIAKYHYEDLKQECLLSLIIAINKFDDSYNKTFYRYAELIIERKIMNFLRQETRYSRHVYLYENIEYRSETKDIVDEISYEKMIDSIRNVQLSGIKESILNEIFFNGKTIEDFSVEHNIDKKEVYNHIYLLRSKLKKDFL